MAGNVKCNHLTLHTDTEIGSMCSSRFAFNESHPTFCGSSSWKRLPNIKVYVHHLRFMRKCVDAFTANLTTRVIRWAEASVARSNTLISNWRIQLHFK